MNNTDKSEQEKRHIAIERFMLTHPKVELGVQPYTYTMPFDTMYEVIDEYVTQRCNQAFPFEETYSFLYNNHKDVLEELEEYLDQTKEGENNG